MTSEDLRVLFVRRSTSMPDFVDEQAHALRASGVTVDLFDLRGRALRAYLGRYGELRRRIRQGQYHLVHAH